MVVRGPAEVPADAVELPPFEAVAADLAPASKNVAVIKANGYGHGMVEVARALQDDAGVRLVRGELDGFVQQRLVGDDAPRLDAAGGGDDRLRHRYQDG